MKYFYRNEVPKQKLPGRFIQRAIGKDALSPGTAMTIGFALYNAEAGPMEPHHHAEESIYILDAKDGWVEFGPEKEKLPTKVMLTRGMVLHVPENEWHVFRYAEGGFVDILFVYAPAI
jgi:mannose-6-phosphate isomerase-like protein (cupin superfamily)